MTNELWPIVVPSYKRGSNAKTLQMLKNGYDKRLNLFLFIYPDDADNYRDIIDSKLFTVVYCEGFRGIVPKRNFINNEMYKRGYENIFVLDDDIPSVHKLEPGVQKKNPSAYRSIKLQTTPYDFFEAFQSIIENADKHLTQTGCVNEMEAAFNDFRKKPSVIYTRFPIQMVHICTKDVIENNIEYRKDHGWDDFDFSLQILSKGLNTGHIPSLTYISDVMEPDKSVANVGNDKWTEIGIYMYKTWGDSIKFIEKKGQVNAKPQRRIIEKKLEKGIPLTNAYYEDCYKDIIKNHDVAGLKKLIVEDKFKTSRSSNFDWSKIEPDATNV
jgi:hypothetical protein